MGLEKEEYQVDNATKICQITSSYGLSFKYATYTPAIVELLLMMAVFVEWGIFSGAIYTLANMVCVLLCSIHALSKNYSPVQSRQIRCVHSMLYSCTYSLVQPILRQIWFVPSYALFMHLFSGVTSTPENTVCALLCSIHALILRRNLYSGKYGLCTLCSIHALILWCNLYSGKYGLCTLCSIHALILRRNLYSGKCGLCTLCSIHALKLRCYLDSGKCGLCPLWMSGMTLLSLTSQP